ncbi:sugar phosphate isomerase/epimerase family protein [Mucilaginibacter sp. KACC 22063]|uniref:sugar phosphate isomerase/epimerase family protein n=1 Tax=Mucilaginibacter sp. KACC 22063 TaxID=3025666 RepID=UPI0023650BE1|nr:sugar phosphate isomerase/epimerase [Mucilaginibacter sp. KACC 22063]WDF54019.1 sugar phosphate isomerase/epimerase [Mucilaginibacter sp. KACC 22063]
MSTRRTFLTQAGLIGAGMLLAPKFSSAKITGKVGLQLYTLREELPKDVKGVIAKIAAAGYKEVETFGYSKEHGFWGLSATEFSALLKKHGLTSPSGHYGMDALLAEGKLGEIDEAIEAARILGQQYIVMPYVDEKFRKTAADLKNIATKLNLAAKRVEKAGLKMGYHNHNFEFEKVDGVMLYDILLKETHADLVHFEMDIYWVVRSGQDPVKWLEAYPGRFTMVHVKDMDKQNHDLNTEVGKGTIDFKSIFKHTQKAGVRHYIVEQENFKIDPFVSITQSSKYLRSLLA